MHVLQIRIQGLFRSIDAPHHQSHMSLIGKLDGVAQQIDQYLPQAYRIAPDHGLGLSFIVKLQGNTLLLGLLLHQLQDMATETLQIKRNLFQLQHAGFNFGEIENVTQYTQQGTTGILNMGQTIALLFGQFRTLQQVGHAENAVEGRADLMAHGGQELTLGPTGRLGFQFGLMQLVSLAALDHDGQGVGQEDDAAPIRFIHHVADRHLDLKAALHKGQGQNRHCQYLKGGFLSAISCIQILKLQMDLRPVALIIFLPQQFGQGLRFSIPVKAEVDLGGQ